MKILRKGLISLFLTVLLLFILSFSALAKEGTQTQKEDLPEDLIEEFSALIVQESGISLEENDLISSFGFGSILKCISDAITGSKGEITSFFLTVMGFAILCAVSDGASFLGSGDERSLSAAVLTVMSAAIYPSLYSLFSSVGKSLETLSSFFGAAMPIMSAISAASGSVKTAAVQAANMNIVLGIVGALATDILLPLSFAILALALVSSFGEAGTLRTAKSIRNIFTFGLGIVTAVSSAAISLQTVIASASDSASLRAARYAAGGLIPVVGSSVSSAISTLAGGLAYAKSTVGAAAIAAIFALVSAPLVLLLLYRLIFSIGQTVLEYLDINAAVRCFSAYKAALDAVISVYVMSTIVCIIQVIVFMKGGAAV